MTRHEPLTLLAQSDLDWIAGFAQRLRSVDPQFAADDAGDEANDIARELWERADWRCMAPQAAANRWIGEPESRPPLWSASASLPAME